MNSAGQYEIEHESPKQPGETSLEPRNTPLLNITILPESGQYQGPAHYTTWTSSVEAITTAMSQTGFQDARQEPVLPSLPQHVRTRNPYTIKEESNSRK
ncbi:hypothetical protein WAI453_012464 [Rhynchosporium graminicola]